MGRKLVLNKDWDRSKFTKENINMLYEAIDMYSNTHRSRLTQAGNIEKNELAQMVMFNLINRKSGFNSYTKEKNPQGIRAYIYKICANTLIDYIKANRSRYRIEGGTATLLSIESLVEFLSETDDRVSSKNEWDYERYLEYTDWYNKIEEDFSLYSFETINSIPEDRIREDKKLTWKELYNSCLEGTEVKLTQKYRIKKEKIKEYTYRLKSFLKVS